MSEKAKKPDNEQKLSGKDTLKEKEEASTPKEVLSEGIVSKETGSEELFSEEDIEEELPQSKKAVTAKATTTKSKSKPTKVVSSKAKAEARKEASVEATLGNTTFVADKPSASLEPFVLVAKGEGSKRKYIELTTVAYKNLIKDVMRVNDSVEDHQSLWAGYKKASPEETKAFASQHQRSLHYLNADLEENNYLYEEAAEEYQKAQELMQGKKDPLSEGDF